MADHIRVGIVYEDEIIDIFLYLLNDGVGHLGRAHLGLLVEMGDRRGRDEDAVLVRESLFISAVEEVGDMRVLFRLGDTELAEPGF